MTASTLFHAGTLPAKPSPNGQSASSSQSTPVPIAQRQPLAEMPSAVNLEPIPKSASSLAQQTAQIQPSTEGSPAAKLKQVQTSTSAEASSTKPLAEMPAAVNMKQGQTRAFSEAHRGHQARCHQPFGALRSLSTHKRHVRLSIRWCTSELLHVTC